MVKASYGLDLLGELEPGRLNPVKHLCGEMEVKFGERCDPHRYPFGTQGSYLDFICGHKANLSRTFRRGKFTGNWMVTRGSGENALLRRPILIRRLVRVTPRGALTAPGIHLMRRPALYTRDLNLEATATTS